MITKKMFHTIQQLQELQKLATLCQSDVGMHSTDSTIIIDAKSYIGMYVLDFSQPILIVSEDEAFHALIKDIGETVE